MFIFLERVHSGGVLSSLCLVSCLIWISECHNQWMWCRCWVPSEPHFWCSGCSWEQKWAKEVLWGGVMWSRWISFMFLCCWWFVCFIYFSLRDCDRWWRCEAWCVRNSPFGFFFLMQWILLLFLLFESVLGRFICCVDDAFCPLRHRILHQGKESIINTWQPLQQHLHGSSLLGYIQRVAWSYLASE